MNFMTRKLFYYCSFVSYLFILNLCSHKLYKFKCEFGTNPIEKSTPNLTDRHCQNYCEHLFYWNKYEQNAKWRFCESRGSFWTINLCQVFDFLSQSTTAYNSLYSALQKKRAVEKLIYLSSLKRTCRETYFLSRCASKPHSIFFWRNLTTNGLRFN